jgi:hypothetical protein
MNTSFSNFVIENLKKDIVNLVVESNLDPWDFIFDFYKEDKQLIYRLKENKRIIEEGLLGNLATAAGRVGGAVSNWLGQTARSGATTAKTAIAAGRDAISGPDARFRAAIDAMNALSKELSNNPMVQQASASDPRYKDIIEKLEAAKSQLQQQQPVVQQLLTMKTNAGQQIGATNRLAGDPGYNIGNVSKQAAPAPYVYKREGD